MFEDISELEAPDLSTLKMLPDSTAPAGPEAVFDDMAIAILAVIEQREQAKRELSEARDLIEQLRRELNVARAETATLRARKP